MAAWTRSAVTEFIGLYRSEECLWKIQSPKYSNRHCKEQSYQKLLRYVQTFDPAATKETIIKKINAIRTTFRREKKKVNSSKISGAGSDEVYVPKLWYFNELLFLLQDQDETRVTPSSLGRHSPHTFKQERSEDSIHGDDLVEGVNVADTDTDTDTEPTQTLTTSTPTPERRQTPEPEPEASTEARPGQSNTNINNNKTGGSKRKAEDELLKIARQRLLNLAPMPKDDQFDAFGNLMAHKMRNLPHEQRVIAERLCHDVMLDAELGSLTRQTRLEHPSTYQA